MISARPARRPARLFTALLLAAAAAFASAPARCDTPGAGASAAAAATALPAMVAFDASYIPALQATTLATQNPQAVPGAQSALAALRADWPALRPRLAQAWGTTAPAAWDAALQRVDTQIAAALASGARADWAAAHDALEAVRLQLAQARQAQGLDYFVDRLTAYHEPMEALALAAAKTRPEQLTPQARAELAHAYQEAVRLWAGIEQFPLDPVQYELTPAREQQAREGLAQERAALDRLGQALQGGDAAAVLKAAASIKPPFARVFTAFGRAPQQRD